MDTILARDCYVYCISVRLCHIQHTDAGYGVFVVRSIRVGGMVAYYYSSLVYIELRLSLQALKQYRKIIMHVTVNRFSVYAHKLSGEVTEGGAKETTF